MIPANQKIDGGPSVLYDAIAVLVSKEGAEMLAEELDDGFIAVGGAKDASKFVQECQKAALLGPSRNVRSMGRQVSVSTIARFAKSLSGEVVLPQERRYGALRKVKNRAVDKRPAVIVRCANRNDVQLAVDFARHNDLLTAVRSGGHSFAGYGVCDGGLVIDLSMMKRVQIDPARETIRIEPGILAGELDCLTQSFRMAVPLGSCPTVGVAGYSLGGGESSLTPKFGYGCDSIVGLEVLTADGKLLAANAEENSDLFWAMRGAGANFGIATSLEFQAPPN